MTQEDYLAHHGILGQKWGVRRYQNSDCSLTEAGKKRYRKRMERALASANKERPFDFGRPKNENKNKVMKKVLKDPEYMKAAEKADALEKNYQKEFKKLWNKYHHEVPGTAGYLDLSEVPNAEKQAYNDAWEKAFPALRTRDQKLMKSLEKNAQELLSAKLEDIGYEDTEFNRQMLNEIAKSKFVMKDDGNIHYSANYLKYM